MLIVTHNNVIRQMVDQVIVIRDGMISEAYMNECPIPASVLKGL